MSSRAGNAAGSVGGQPLGARQADGSASVEGVGHVDGLDPGAVRVQEPHPLDAAEVARVLAVLAQPALFLEGPAEGVGAVLRDRVGEMLPAQTAAPRLDHRDPLGRRALQKVRRIIYCNPSTDGGGGVLPA